MDDLVRLQRACFLLQHVSVSIQLASRPTRHRVRRQISLGHPHDVDESHHICATECLRVLDVHEVPTDYSVPHLRSLDDGRFMDEITVCDGQPTILDSVPRTVHIHVDWSDGVQWAQSSSNHVVHGQRESQSDVDNWFRRSVRLTGWNGNPRNCRGRP